MIFFFPYSSFQLSEFARLVMMEDGGGESRWRIEMDMDMDMKREKGKGKREKGKGKIDIKKGTSQ